MAAQYHHGRTPAAWTGAIIAFTGFVVTCACTLASEPIGFWIGIGVVLIGAITGGLMSAMGMGARHEPLRLVGGKATSDTTHEHAGA